MEGTFEKRVYPRHRLRTEVVFEDEWGQGFIYFYSTDLSLGGIFFESELPLKQGTKVFLSFKLPNNPAPIRATGEVVRQEREAQDPSRVIGTGIRFGDLSAKTAALIETFLEESPHA